MSYATKAMADSVAKWLGQTVQAIIDGCESDDEFMATIRVNGVSFPSGSLRVRSVWRGWTMTTTATLGGAESVRSWTFDRHHDNIMDTVGEMARELLTSAMEKAR